MQTQVTSRLSPFKEAMIQKLRLIIKKEDEHFLKLQERGKKNLKESGVEKPVGGDHNADVAVPAITNPQLMVASNVAQIVAACRNAIVRIMRNPHPWECQECGGDLTFKDLQNRPWANIHLECQKEIEKKESRLRKMFKH